MTHAELITAVKAFETEHGYEETIELLSDITLATAQAAGLTIEYCDDEDEDGEPVAVHALN